MMFLTYRIEMWVINKSLQLVLQRNNGKISICTISIHLGISLKTHIGFPLINHPFGGSRISGNLHLKISEVVGHWIGDDGDGLTIRFTISTSGIPDMMISEIKKVIGYPKDVDPKNHGEY